MKPLPPVSKIGIGVVTYNRPQYLKQCLQGVKKLKADSVYVHDDHSDKPYAGVIPGEYYYSPKNKGVAKSKNWLFKKLLKDGCTYIFLLEDDVIPVSKSAVWGYIGAARESGLHHYNFAHHGPANKDGPLDVRGKSAFYPHFVGAWSMYTSTCLEDVGLMDENFHNAWEHVEHTFRLAKKHYTTWPLAADAKESYKWLHEIPGSIDNSSIRPQKNWGNNVVMGYDYWKRKDADFPLAPL